MITKEKVLIYVVRYKDENPEVLVFDHRLYPEVSPQVPAGTIEANESPVNAAVRELEEESGLKFDKNEAIYIGKFTYIRKDIKEKHSRHCYLFISSNQANSWTHQVSSGEEDKGYFFDYRWIEIKEASKLLVAGMGTYLPSALKLKNISYEM